MSKENKGIMPEGKSICLMLNRDDIMLGFLEKDINRKNWVEAGRIKEEKYGAVFYKKLLCGSLEILVGDDKETTEALKLISPEDIKMIGVFENDAPIEVINIPEERGKMIEKDKITFIFGTEKNIEKLSNEKGNIVFVNKDNDEVVKM